MLKLLINIFIYILSKKNPIIIPAPIRSEGMPPALCDPSTAVPAASPSKTAAGSRNEQIPAALAFTPTFTHYFPTGFPAQSSFELHARTDNSNSTYWLGLILKFGLINRAPHACAWGHMIMLRSMWQLPLDSAWSDVGCLTHAACAWLRPGQADENRPVTRARTMYEK